MDTPDPHLSQVVKVAVSTLFERMAKTHKPRPVTESKLHVRDTLQNTWSALLKLPGRTTKNNESDRATAKRSPWRADPQGRRDACARESCGSLSRRGLWLAETHERGPSDEHSASSSDAHGALGARHESSLPSS